MTTQLLGPYTRQWYCGVLIMKELNNDTDDQLLESMIINYQYALHTTRFTKQPVSDRTMSRFRERLDADERRDGILADAFVTILVSTAGRNGSSTRDERIGS